MRLRNLRIAWSAFCGVASVLLILFWARRYWWVDGGTIPLSAKHSFVIGSAVETFVIGLDTPSESLSFVQRSVEDWKHDDRNPSPIWGGIIREQGRFVVLIPDWFLAILTAAACIVLGYRQLEWRF